MREILSDMLNDAARLSTCLLIDALEECMSGLSSLIYVIANASLERQSGPG